MQPLHFNKAEWFMHNPRPNSRLPPTSPGHPQLSLSLSLNWVHPLMSSLDSFSFKSSCSRSVGSASTCKCYAWVLILPHITRLFSRSWKRPSLLFSLSLPGMPNACCVFNFVLYYEGSLPSLISELPTVLRVLLTLGEKKPTRLPFPKVTLEHLVLW